MSREHAVLLVGHGTRDQAGTDEFFELARRLETQIDPIPVAAALLEFQQPTIPEAWQSLVQQGVKHIHVSPLLLFAAGHAKQDIPEILMACQAETPDVAFDQSTPLSRHRCIIDVVCDRITNTLSVSDGKIAVVMVGRGSHDPCAQSDMKLLTEVVSYRLKLEKTFTAFYAMAEPKLPDVLEQVAGSGIFDTVIVYPHLLFNGRLYQAICKQTKEAAQKFPDTSFRTAAYLGPCDEVATAIAQRASANLFNGS